MVYRRSSLGDADYEALVEDAPIGIFVSSSDGRFLHANGATARLLGLPSADALLRHYDDLARQLYRDPGRRADLLRRLREEGAISALVVQAVRADGEPVSLELTARRVQPSDLPDGPFEIHGFMRDVTERVRSEALLREQRAMLDRSDRKRSCRERV